MKKTVFIIISLALLLAGCKGKNEPEQPVKKANGFTFDGKTYALDKVFVSNISVTIKFSAEASDHPFVITTFSNTIGKNLEPVPSWEVRLFSKEKSYKAGYLKDAGYQNDAKSGAVRIREINKDNAEYELEFDITFTDGKIFKGYYSGKCIRPE